MLPFFWVYWRYLYSTDISWEPQFCYFPPFFFSCNLFSNIFYFYIIIFYCLCILFFFVSLYICPLPPLSPSIVGRGFLTFLFYEYSPILPTPLFKTSLLPPNLQPTALFDALFFRWASDQATLDVLLYEMICHMSSFGTLVSKMPCYVFYATRGQVYWGLTYNVLFYWYSGLIPHTHTHTHTHTLTHTHTERQHTQGLID